MALFAGCFYLKPQIKAEESFENGRRKFLMLPKASSNNCYLSKKNYSYTFNIGYALNHFSAYHIHVPCEIKYSTIYHKLTLLILTEIHATCQRLLRLQTLKILRLEYKLILQMDGNPKYTVLLPKRKCASNTGDL